MLHTPARFLAAALAPLVVSAGLLGPGAPTAAAQSYTVVDLGSLNGANSWGWRLNDRGDATGWSTTAGAYPEAYLWTAESGMVGLGLLPATSASYGLGINDARAVTGYAGLTFETTRGFLAVPGRSLQPLGTLGGAQSWARDLDNAGRIVGESDTGSGERHAFLWQDGGMTPIAPLPPSTLSEARAVSDAGHVVGNAGDAPYLWIDGTTTVLASLGGKSLPRDVNDRGHVVGSSALGDGPCQTCNTRAALWLGDRVVNLGVLAPPGTPAMVSVANGINNLDQSVGYSTIPSGNRHGFLCEKDCSGGPIDLNDRVPEGWIVGEAYAINDAGEILATGSFGAGGLLRALLLRPEEPHTVLLAPDPGEAGRRNRFEVRWAEPGSWVVVLRGEGLGTTPLPFCQSSLEIDEPRIVGFARANAEGVAAVERRIRADLAGRQLVLQALDLGTCKTSAVSTHTF